MTKLTYLEYITERNGYEKRIHIVYNKRVKSGENVQSLNSSHFKRVTGCGGGCWWWWCVSVGTVLCSSA